MFLRSHWCALIAYVLLTISPCGLTADESTSLNWHDSYTDAYRMAQENEQLLFIFFHEEKPTTWLKFASIVENSPEIRDRLAGFSLAKVPLNESIKTESSSSERVIDNPSFAELRQEEGIAIVDLSNRESHHYAHVVSVYPFTANPFATGGMISKGHLAELLKLPAGTLTQRSMIFAVRVHPERPVSADTQFCSILSAEAEKHSQYQADIVDQGHHNWSSRFHSINAKLPGGLIAQEVVAESWPNENLMTAAKECVYSWRRSSGHWSAVRANNDRFAYDMKRGRNGIWYATRVICPQKLIATISRRL